MTDKGHAAMDDAIAELRLMPTTDRCEALIGMFLMVVSEFAAMVHEHCEAEAPPPPLSTKTRRAVNKLRRKVGPRPRPRP